MERAPPSSLPPPTVEEAGRSMRGRKKGALGCCHLAVGLPLLLLVGQAVVQTALGAGAAGTGGVGGGGDLGGSGHGGDVGGCGGGLLLATQLKTLLVLWGKPERLILPACNCLRLPPGGGSYS